MLTSPPNRMKEKKEQNKMKKSTNNSDKKRGEIQKKMKKNSNSDKKSGEIEMISDERFAPAQSDPRFMEAPKQRSKVEIDRRFRHVLTDPRFNSSNAPVDKRGKPRNNHKKAAASSLERFYRLQPQHEDDEKPVSPIDRKKHRDIRVESHETESESDESNEDDDEDGESLDESSSTSTTDSDSDSDSDGQSMEDEEEDTFMQPEDNVPEIDEETRRLAVVNLDWSHVRAVDLYVLLSSFLPKGGQILSVTVYPTEFGLKRMEEEAVRGPVGLFDEDDDDDEHDGGEDDEIDQRKLRAYELSRLRYYYAVVECESIATADYLYKTCDGVELERSANKLDLRFIPDTLEFKHQPRDVATEAPADYEGLDFQTRALQHSNIHLTWDEDEPQRAKTLKRKFNDEQLAVLDMKDFIAPPDGSDTDDDDNSDDTADLSVKKSKKRDKYRTLIQSGDGSDEDEDNDQDMEVTFNSGLEDLSKRLSEKKDKKSETVWEAYLRKKKEKKKASKKGSKYSSEDSSGRDSDQEPAEQPDDFFVEEPLDTGNKAHPVRSTKKRKTDKETNKETGASLAVLELLTANDMGAEANSKGYNLKPKKIKGKKGEATPDEGKFPSAEYDDRFSSLFTSPLFALDPTDPQFKRSAVYARQITHKNKTGENENGQVDQSETPGDASSMHKDENIASDGLSQRKNKNELSALVRSIKMKSKQIPVPSKVSWKSKNVPDKAKIRK